MSLSPLSALDEAFLALESPQAPMHVGWAALFSPPSGAPRPSFEELSAHIEGRLGRAPRYRQKLVPVPLGSASRPGQMTPTSTSHITSSARRAATSADWSTR